MLSAEELNPSYDELLERLPSVRNWQVLVALLTCVAASFGGFFITWPSFVEVEVPYECSLWIKTNNATRDEPDSASVSPQFTIQSFLHLTVGSYDRYYSN